MVLQAIKYVRGKLEILDQLRLPHREVYISISTVEEAWHAIKSMQVRGAPAIAIVAALALAVELQAQDHIPESKDSGSADARETIIKKLRYLVTSRPTAVNLADAAKKLEKVVIQGSASGSASSSSVKEAYIAAAEQMLVDDLADNEAIGRYGAQWILNHSTGTPTGEKVTVLTHCNTGSLATAGYGTALGVVRSLHTGNALRHVYYTETRPYNQGSRLTGYELLHDGIQATLITDSMAAALFKLKKEAENIVAVVVGADRVAANGDTANKIGTYALAILAQHHNIKFLVAAPRTTIDLNTRSGDAIVIEERPPNEITAVKGPRVITRNSEKHIDKDTTEEVSIAPEGTQAWNPAFDVTPAFLISGIVTEVGVVERDKGKDDFDLAALFEERETGSTVDGTRKPMPSPSEGP